MTSELSLLLLFARFFHGGGVIKVCNNIEEGERDTQSHREEDHEQPHTNPSRRTTTRLPHERSKERNVEPPGRQAWDDSKERWSLADDRRTRKPERPANNRRSAPEN